MKSCAISVRKVSMVVTRMGKFLDISSAESWNC
jgi:hypothetical protein